MLAKNALSILNGILIVWKFMEKENNTTALHLERNQPDPTLLENEPLSAHARHFTLTGTASRGIKERAQL